MHQCNAAKRSMQTFRRGLFQDVTFNLILWYVLKTIYLTQEKYKFLIKISFVFLACFFCLYDGLKPSISTKRSILDTNIFSIFVLMTFDHGFCCVLMQTRKVCMLCWYISILSHKTHRTGYSNHCAVVCIIYLKPKIQAIMRCKPIVLS